MGKGEKKTTIQEPFFANPRVLIGRVGVTALADRHWCQPKPVGAAGHSSYATAHARARKSDNFVRNPFALRSHTTAPPLLFLFSEIFFPSVPRSKFETTIVDRGCVFISPPSANYSAIAIRYSHFRTIQVCDAFMFVPRAVVEPLAIVGAALLRFVQLCSLRRSLYSRTRVFP